MNAAGAKIAVPTGRHPVSPALVSAENSNVVTAAPESATHFYGSYGIASSDALIRIGHFSE
jgi:hypothetical protein